MAAGRCGTCAHYRRSEDQNGGVMQVCEVEPPKHVAEYRMVPSAPGPNGEPPGAVLQLLNHSIQRPTQHDWGCAQWSVGLAKVN